MNEKPSVLLHVGFPKTGTTWLQDRVFSDPRLFEVPWPTAGNRIIEAMCWMPHDRFDPQALRKEFEGQAAPGKVSVISHEVLVGDPTRGYYWGEATARRLHQTFPNARVLITLREQARLAYASWCEYVRRGGTLSLFDYISRGGVREVGMRAFLPIEYLRFSPIVRLYQELFGAGRVLVLPQEMMLKEQTTFLGAMASFLGTDELQVANGAALYQSLPPQVISLQRVINRFMTRDTAPRPAKRRVKKALSYAAKVVTDEAAARKKRAALDWLEETIHPQVMGDNRQLEASGLSWSLQAFGYRLPSTGHQSSTSSAHDQNRALSSGVSS